MHKKSPHIRSSMIILISLLATLHQVHTNHAQPSKNHVEHTLLLRPAPEHVHFRNRSRASRTGLRLCASLGHVSHGPACGCVRTSVTCLMVRPTTVCVPRSRVSWSGPCGYVRASDPVEQLWVSRAATYNTTVGLEPGQGPRERLWKHRNGSRKQWCFS